VRIFVAKYIPDVRRWEPRNVGVFVEERGGFESRFFGEVQPGVTDHRTTRHVVNDPEVYDEWVSYWRRATTIEELAQRQVANYWVAEAGEVWLAEEDTDAATIADRYYRELIAEPPEEREVALERRVERLLRDSGVLGSEAFQRDVEIESDPRKLPERQRYKFPYAVENGRLTVGQRVSFHVPYFNDALWKFTHVRDEIRKVAFIDARDTPAQPAELSTPVSLLQRESEVIDVGDPQALNSVADAFAT
jgi:hypothetical protein